MRKRILITGASGFLGATLVAEAQSDWDVIAVSLTHPIIGDVVSSHSHDLSVPETVADLVGKVRPDVIINCAAMTSVDGCEHERELAMRLNADAVGALAVACQRGNIRLVHVSTDAVFGGGPPPYTEVSPPHPLNWYGHTKLAGETQVLESCSNALIARTNIVGWSPNGSRSLLEYFFNGLVSGDSPPGFTDLLFRPATTPQVARALLELARGTDRGIVHLTGDRLISKYDFGVLVAETFGFDAARIRPASVATSGLTAPRANCLDVVPSTWNTVVNANIHLNRGMAELRDLLTAGYRSRLKTLVGIEEI